MWMFVSVGTYILNECWTTYCRQEPGDKPPINHSGDIPDSQGSTAAPTSCHVRHWNLGAGQPSLLFNRETARRSSFQETFQEVMHDHLQLMKFFDLHLPGCKRFEYTGCHPCVHFQFLGSRLAWLVGWITHEIDGGFWMILWALGTYANDCFWSFRSFFVRGIGHIKTFSIQAFNHSYLITTLEFRVFVRLYDICWSWKLFAFVEDK